MLQTTPTNQTAGTTAARRPDAEDAIVTAHFAARCRERRVPAEAIALALRHGRQFHEGPDTVHFLGRRELRDLGCDAHSDWQNTVVVRAGNTLKTTFQSPHYLRKLKRRRWGMPCDVRHEQNRRRSRDRRHHGSGA